MDFRRWWYRTKKKAKKRWKKFKRWFKRYIRLLVRHTKAKDYSVLMYTIGAILGFILVIFLIGKMFSAIGGGKSVSDERRAFIDSLTATEATTEDPNIQIAEQCKIIYEGNKEYLQLVNATHPLDDAYTFEHHTLNCGLDIDERAYADFAALTADFNGQGLYYTVVSAYRSKESQQNVINEEVQKYIGQGMTEEEAFNKTMESIQPAGCSEHQTGLAMDLNPEGNYILDESVESSPEIQWLQENAYKYGYILRYPKDKQAFTNITYEPWHFRYVGREAAAYLHNNNMSLEEFWYYLENY